MADWAKLSRSDDLAELFTSPPVQEERARIEGELLTKKDLSDLERAYKIGRRDMLLHLTNLPNKQLQAAMKAPEEKAAPAPRHPNPVL